MKTYELISVIREPLNILRSKNINPSSVEYLQLYEDYCVMNNEGLKKTYIISVLCEKYNIGRTKFFQLINSFEEEI